MGSAEKERRRERSLPQGRGFPCSFRKKQPARATQDFEIGVRRVKRGENKKKKSPILEMTKYKHG